MGASPLVDTNVVVRIVTGDPPHLAAACRRTLTTLRDEGRTVVVPFLIVAEVIHTLRTVYDVPRPAAFVRLRRLLDDGMVRLTDPLVAEQVFSLWGWRGLSFHDAYLAAKGRSEGVPIVTLDADLAATPGLDAIRPT